MNHPELTKEEEIVLAKALGVATWDKNNDCFMRLGSVPRRKHFFAEIKSGDYLVCRKLVDYGYMRMSKAVVHFKNDRYLAKNGSKEDKEKGSHVATRLFSVTPAGEMYAVSQHEPPEGKYRNRLRYDPSVYDERFTCRTCANISSPDEPEPYCYKQHDNQCPEIGHNCADYEYDFRKHHIVEANEQAAKLERSRKLKNARNRRSAAKKKAKKAAAKKSPAEVQPG